MNLRVHPLTHPTALAMVTASLVLATTTAIVADTRVQSHTATQPNQVGRNERHCLQQRGMYD